MSPPRFKFRPPQPPLGLYDAHLQHYGPPPACAMKVFPDHALAASPSKRRQTPPPRPAPGNNRASPAHSDNGYYAGSRWQSAAPQASSLPAPVFAELQAAQTHFELRRHTHSDTDLGESYIDRSPTAIPSLATSVESSPSRGLADTAFWLDSPVKSKSPSSSALALLDSLSDDVYAPVVPHHYVHQRPTPPHVVPLHLQSPCARPIRPHVEPVDAGAELKRLLSIA